MTVPPAQVVVAFDGAAMVTPAGRTSVNARSVTGVPDGFVIENVSVDTLPGPMVSGANTLRKVGCAEASTAAPRRTAVSTMGSIPETRVGTRKIM